MAEPTKIPLARLKLTRTTTIALNEIKEELHRRGLKDFNSALAVERAFEKLGPSFLNEVIDDFTPFEYRLQLALSDDRHRKQIEKIIENCGKKPLKAESGTKTPEVQ